MFKFTLTIATSAFLFMSGTADLFAMNDDHDKALGSSSLNLYENARWWERFWQSYCLGAAPNPHHISTFKPK